MCVSHGKKQATGPEAEDTAKKKTASKKAGDEQRARKKHPLENAAMVGLVAIGLLVLRRVIRLF